MTTSRNFSHVHLFLVSYSWKFFGSYQNKTNTINKMHLMFNIDFLNQHHSHRQFLISICTLLRLLYGIYISLIIYVTKYCARSDKKVQKDFYEINKLDQMRLKKLSPCPTYGQGKIYGLSDVGSTIYSFSTINITYRLMIFTLIQSMY